MKPKYFFWICCVGFLALAVKFILAEESATAALMFACAVASVLNAQRPGADHRTTMADIMKLFGVK